MIKIKKMSEVNSEKEIYVATGCCCCCCVWEIPDPEDVEESDE